MRHVYIIRSISSPDKIYTGLTSNLEKRLTDHNRGRNRYTKMNRPWEIIVSMQFKNDLTAKAFEAYLKSGSGRAFVKRHFL